MKFLGRRKSGVSKNCSSREVGQLAEDYAFNYLIKKGLKVVARNYLCRVGEVDLIMRDGTWLVFIEVRCRKSSAFGSGVETVVRAKQLKLIKAARCYMVQHKLDDNIYCRFDVVGVVLSGNTNMVDITWIRDAFQVE